MTRKKFKIIDIQNIAKYNPLTFSSVMGTKRTPRDSLFWRANYRACSKPEDPVFTKYALVAFISELAVSVAHEELRRVTTGLYAQ
jgi:hypothetical protein